MSINSSRLFQPTAGVQQLADALRPALGMAARQQELSASTLRLALDHRVAPLLHHAQQLAGYECEPEIAARLAHEAQGNVHRILRQKAAAMTFGRLLDDAGIGFRLVKGYDVGRLLYGTESLRVAKDVDVLLAPDQIGRALTIARDAGYRRPGGKRLSAAVGRAILMFHREMEIVDPRTGIVLELHSRLLDRPPPGWDDRQFLSGPLDLTSPDHVLYLILHGAAGQWRRLKWMADLAMIARRTPADVRSRVITLARKYDCLPAVHASLLACGVLWEDELVRDWLAETGLSETDERVSRHLREYTRTLDRDTQPDSRQLAARRLELEREEPVFGTAHPSRPWAMGKRAALWFLRRL